MMARLLPLHLLRFRRLWAWENGSLYSLRRFNQKAFNIIQYSRTQGIASNSTKPRFVKLSRKSLHTADCQGPRKLWTAMSPVCILRCAIQREVSVSLRYMQSTHIIWSKLCLGGPPSLLAWMRRIALWAGTLSIIEKHVKHRIETFFILFLQTNLFSSARILLYQQTNWTWRSLGSPVLCSPQRLRKSLTGWFTATSGTSTSHCPFTKKSSRLSCSSPVHPSSTEIVFPLVSNFWRWPLEFLGQGPQIQPSMVQTKVWQNSDLQHSDIVTWTAELSTYVRHIWNC